MHFFGNYVLKIILMQADNVMSENEFLLNIPFFNFIRLRLVYLVNWEQGVAVSCCVKHLLKIRLVVRSLGRYLFLGEIIVIKKLEKAGTIFIYWGQKTVLCFGDLWEGRIGEPWKVEYLNRH